MIFLPWLKTTFSGLALGLLPHQEDERDFGFGEVFGASAYQPKHRVYEIPTLSIKNQSPLNTCVWNSATVQKEVAEGTQLSVRYLVAKAKQKGRLSGNGFASLRDAQQTLIDTGICEESLLPNVMMDWASYSSTSPISMNALANAEQHKASRFFIVKTKDEMLKAIDDGLVIQTGMMWRTGYRSPAAPFILNIGSGNPITGHAFVLKGYDLNRNVWKFQNSFGPYWGDKGDFYVRMADWSGFPGYVSVDADNSTLIASYEGKDVKSDDSPVIFRIQKGQKRPFLSEQSFFNAGGRFGTDKTWKLISKSLLNSIPVGQPMP